MAVSREKSYIADARKTLSLGGGLNNVFDGLILLKQKLTQTQKVIISSIKNWFFYNIMFLKTTISQNNCEKTNSFWIVLLKVTKLHTISVVTLNKNKIKKS